jgi:hypothetical protein
MIDALGHALAAGDLFKQKVEKKNYIPSKLIAFSSPIGIREGVHTNICALREGEQRRITNVCSPR